MKKIITVLGAVLLVFGLSSCSKGLSSLTIEGAVDKTVSVGETFNVYEGVSVLGDDGVDYSEAITVHSYACGVDENSNLYTTTAKTCDITYIAVVSGKYVSKSISITIK